jgi:5-methylcytosine-specific restriction endonuclease McrA
LAGCKKRRLEDIEGAKARRKRYYEANREQAIADAKRWYTENIEAARKTAAKNRRLWRKRNPDKVRAWKRARSYRERGAGPIDAQLVSAVLAAGACIFCGGFGGLTIDHLLPISRGGTNDARNLVPACRTCNSSKQASDWRAWFKKQPFFEYERLRALELRYEEDSACP